MVLIKYDKVKVILTNSLYSILNQLNFYKKYNHLKNPFISKIFYAFQDKSSFYLVKKYYPGGDLRYHLNRKIFSEQKAKFIIANIILGLEFIHSIGYIYRNLIPQNLIFDKKGYIHINDMTLIREKSSINYLITSGHAGYIAPEIIFRNNYGIESDFYSLGVILYEIMFNKLPYKSNSREEYLNDLASNHNALIKEDELNVGWSRECADFINRCIQKRAEVRIGYGGIEELKSHIWLKDFDWEGLKKGELQAPFIPSNKNHFSIRNNDKDKIIFMEENIKNFVEYYEVMNYFKGYYYNYNLDKNYKKETIKKKEINNEQADDKKDGNDDNLGETSKENEDGEGEGEEEKHKDYMHNDDMMDKFDYLKNTKKKNYNNSNEENSHDGDGDDDDNQINLNLNKRKKNRKKKDDDDEDENYDKRNYKENRNQKRKKRETTDTRNFYDEESKGQLMNVKNKKGLLNKNSNKKRSQYSKNRKSNESRDVLNIYKRKNKYDD